jgi:hypothetical protein
MLVAIITALIYLCVLVLVVYLIFWVLGQIGINLPPQVIKIVWVVVALIAILVLVQNVLPSMGLKFGRLTELQLARV